ncbi:MAG: capsid protein [bacterium]|nr:capsid protein [bacterium]
MRIMDAIKSGIRSWLRVMPAQASMIAIQETLDFESNAIKNRLWYRGDGKELSQLYSQIPGNETSFWGAKSTPGMEIRKIHVGLPGDIVDAMANIVVSDMGKIELKSKQEEWDKIAKENNFDDLVKKAVTETLYIGDGAFKVSFDPMLSDLPIIEFYAGDKIDIHYRRGRVCEVVFKTSYIVKDQEYILQETYGYGYIKYNLTKNGSECSLDSIEATKGLVDVTWDDNFMMAVPMMFHKSSKWEGRGKSIFDTKTDNFDALDEAWSQWIDALRANRTKEYIPENMLPRSPITGEVLAPNSFDHRYIKTDAPLAEGLNNKIELEQGEIPHESYLSTYVTALDLCLQGIISPSTLGIDGNKMKDDTATAQIEREKVTLYTRANILDALPGVIEKTVDCTMKANETMLAFMEKRSPKVENIEIDVPFGEYNSPSFDAVITTVVAAKTGGVMSIEASVEEMYGDTRDEEWKAEEVRRLKAEQGIAEVEELTIADIPQIE